MLSLIDASTSGWLMRLSLRIFFCISSLSSAVVVGINPVDPVLDIRKLFNLVDGAGWVFIIFLPSCAGGKVLMNPLAILLKTLRVCCSVGGARGSWEGPYGWSVVGGVNALVRISNNIHISIQCRPCCALVIWYSCIWLRNSFTVAA